MPDLESKKCARQECNNTFVPKRHWQIYCSKACNRLAYWTRSILDEEAPTRKTTRQRWTSEEPKQSARDRLHQQRVLVQAELMSKPDDKSIEKAMDMYSCPSPGCFEYTDAPNKLCSTCAAKETSK